MSGFFNAVWYDTKLNLCELHIIGIQIINYDIINILYWYLSTESKSLYFLAVTEGRENHSF